MPSPRCCFCRAKKRKFKFAYLGDEHAVCCLKHYREPGRLEEINLVIAERQRLAKLETTWTQ
jgi:hypothetical protein